MDKKGMEIIELQIENIRKIVAVSINPKGSSTLITGKNSQGKTTVLDSIQMLLESGKTFGDSIQHGKDMGKISAGIGNDGEVKYKVEKKILKGRNILTVKSVDGGEYGQKFLDGLIGNLAFDPLEFANLKPKDQNETLRKLINIDFSLLDQQKAEHYEDRTEIGREIRRLEAQISSFIEDYEDVPDEEISLLTLHNSIEHEKAKEAGQIENIGRIMRAQENIKINKEEILDLKDAIKKLEENIIDDETLIKDLETLNSEITFNYVDLEKQLENADEINRKVREKQKLNVIQNELKKNKQDHEEKTAHIKTIENQKNMELKNAEMPIPGLSVTDDNVIYNGNVFSELSSAEKLKISLAIAMKMNPKLKIILIRDGSLLDSGSLELVEEMAKDQGYHLWIEKVADGPGDIGFYIEEGSLKEKKQKGLFD